LNYFAKHDDNSRIFTKFAVPKIGFMPRKRLIVRDLMEINLKVILRCYNLREPSLEGNRRTA
jgi:hypothetical protein